MPISFSQPYELVCPTCNTPFTTETWVIVDAGERPELVEAIRSVTLHDTACPSCGQPGVVPAPLLYHDRAARAVIFGVPRGMAEEEWREVAQALLWTLIGALPRDQQLPYLGEVQAEDGLAGVAQALEGLRPVPQSAAEAIGDALGNEEADALPPLAEAMLALLEAQSPAEFERVLRVYPFLLDEAMDEGLAGLAEAATDQGEFEVGQAFERARLVLGQLRATLDRAAADRLAGGQPPDQPGPPDQRDQGEELAAPPAGWGAARRALLALDDAAGLPDLIVRHPSLADPAADAWLAADERILRDSGDLAGAQLLTEARAVLRGERE